MAVQFADKALYEWLVEQIARAKQRPCGTDRELDVSDAREAALIEAKERLEQLWGEDLEPAPSRSS